MAPKRRSVQSKGRSAARLVDNRKTKVGGSVRGGTVSDSSSQRPRKTAPTANRLQSDPDEDTERVSVANEPLLNQFVTPSHIAASPSTITADDSRLAAELELERQTQIAVSQFVTKTIFPHLKFLDDGNYSLTFSAEPHSLCNLVATNCFRNRVMSAAWWEDHGKRIVRASISRLRSDKMQGVKRAFKGT